MMDYYLDQVENEQIKALSKKLIEIGKIKRNIIETKQRDFPKREDVVWLYPSEENLKFLPLNTTLIKIFFKLAKPYNSRDDSKIYTTSGGKSLENPIVRDKLTGLAMVKPTGWKGHLRFAAERVNEDDNKNKREIIKRLFGASDNENDDNMKGNLYFYPSFFRNKIKEDVMTPLDRKNRTPVEGKSPISIEVIPKDSESVFYLLYFPYLLSNEKINEDLKFLGEALKLLFYTYGFSAKKSSGFGIIRKISENELEVYPKKFKDYFRTLSETDKGGDR